MSITVLLADDHTLIREGMKTVFAKKTKDITIIGEASNGREVLQIAENSPADVYLMDISMPLLNGIETTTRLLKIDRNSKIIILSMHDDNELVEEALQCGVKGYLLKDDPWEVIIYAIREVSSGRFFLSPNISGFVIQRFLKGKPKNKPTSLPLSSREKEILQLIGEGLSNRDIASQLIISSHTILTHRKNIMKKLDLHRQVDLVRYALNKELPPSPSSAPAE